MKTIKHSILTLLSLVLLGTQSLSAGNGGDGDSTLAPYPINSNGPFALGIRTIGTTGLTFKQYNGTKAFEGILGFGNNSFSITALAERYSNDMEVDNLSLYYGVGGHMVIRSDTNFGIDRNRFSDEDDSFGAGLDFILGMELAIPQTPIAVSLDVKPFFEVTTSGNAYVGLDPGFGVKLFF